MKRLNYKGRDGHEGWVMILPFFNSYSIKKIKKKKKNQIVYATIILS